jgi:hypothetical protein
MKFIIIGAFGNFSLQLQKILSPSEYVVIGHESYRDGNGFNLDLKKDLYRLKNNEESQYLINTVGVISKNYSLDYVDYWNYKFPRFLHELCQELNMTLITLGSVHENYDGMVLNNKYLGSKLKLKEYLSEKCFTNAIHFQFHTWYGGHRVHSEMFLGQVIHSIKNNTVFKLHEGNRIREYHHIYDDAKCFLKTISKGANDCNVISHGEHLTLSYISQAIFSFFNCDDNLDSSNSSILSKQDINYFDFGISNCSFRPTIGGLIDYVKTQIPNSR